MTRAAALFALVGIAACSSVDPENMRITPRDASPNPIPGFEAGVPAASGTVSIEFLSPVEDPNMMLTTNAAVDVSAKIMIVTGSGTDVIDPASVRMSLTAESGETVRDAPLIGPVGIDLFRGKLSVAKLRTGVYTITITASSTGGAIGARSIKVNIDGGPVITVLSPIDGHSYKGSVAVQVVVDAPVMDLQATIAGTPVPLMPTGQANQFRAIVDLTMPVALVGEQIFTVSAKNANGTRTEIRFLFFVDVAGPLFTKTQPIPGQIVGGVIKILTDIADPAGLNESSLQVIIGDKTTPQFRLVLNPEGGATYSALFDTKLLTTCDIRGTLCNVRPVISFRAADLLGNETNVAYTFAVDNQPPVADLDPPKIRVSKISEGAIRCSHDFDPLDHDIVPGDAPNDLCQVPQMFDLRARVQDFGNGIWAEGTKADPIAAVDPERTAVYILDNTTINGEAQPLVVDTDGDGFCDDVNPRLETTTTPLTTPRQALKIRMRPVKPGGSGDFATPDPALVGCLPGVDANPPEDLCEPGPQPTVAISYAGGLPAIWTIEPVPETGGPGYCFGSQLDTFANNLHDIKHGAIAATLGWKCIAVVTSDLVGNRATSTPLRVYLEDFDYGLSGNFCKAPPANAGPPPNCTGTFNKMTSVVSNTPCKTRSYKLPAGQTEVCHKSDCAELCYQGLCKQ